MLSVAKLRLADLEAEELKKAEHQIEATDGKMTFADLTPWQRIDLVQDGHHRYRQDEIDQQQVCLAAGMCLLFEEVHKTANGLAETATTTNSNGSFSFALAPLGGYFEPVLSGGVMVAQESLELFVMVRIHAGQPAHGGILPTG